MLLFKRLQGIRSIQCRGRNLQRGVAPSLLHARKPHFKLSFHTSSSLSSDGFAEAGKTKSTQWRSFLDIGLGLIGSGLLGYSFATWNVKPASSADDLGVADEKPQYGSPEDFAKAIADLKTTFPSGGAVSTDPDVLHGHGFSMIRYLPATACSSDMFQFEGSLLPNLRTISCTNGERDILWNIYPFLSSKLESFWMYVRQPPGANLATMTLLSALETKSPRIKHLLIQGGFFHNVELKSCISTPICGLLHLHIFECAEIVLTWEAVSHLASLPSLHQAEIRVQGEINTVSSPHSPFPALRHLALCGNNITPAIEFVKHFIRSALLESFQICVENELSSVQLGQIFSLLLAHTSPEHLTSIQTHHPEYISCDEPLPLLKASDFDPLFRFTNLEHLLIQTECSAGDFDDTTLEAMARAWPKLRDLCFIGHCGLGGNYPSKCTLRGILHLAKHCPHLSSLAIPFQASAMISWNGRPGGGVVNEEFRELDVGQSPITNPRAVASFLSDVFPKLSTITAWEDINPP